MIARLCAERPPNQYLNEACVYLYRMMGWFEEAVDLALNINVDLAREIANSIGGELGSGNSFTLDEGNMEELRKLLWLRIARHVIEKENDVNKVMEFLHELSESIAIEDVLPYFPDFVTIDQFKDAIRASLAAYTEKIQTLKESIDQAASSAQSIRRDIQAIRQKSIIVNANDLCSLCRFRLMNRRFYVFPCLHKFHSDCLYQTSQPYLLPSKQRRIDELQKLLQDIQTVPTLNAQQTSQLTSPTSPIAVNASSASPSNSSTTGAVAQLTNAALSGLASNVPLVTSVTSGVSNAISHFATKSSSKGNVPGTQTQTYSIEEINRLKTELDELLASECPWCGERILKTIDEPFIDPLKYDEVYNSWL
jgi:vacuolar protein sorting-associated protein 18